MNLLILLFPLIALAWLPSCSYNDCLSSWDTSDCSSQSGLSCVCTNTTQLAQINTCIATSCTNATDQEQIYGAVAQLCANVGQTVTNQQQATFSATSGGSLLAIKSGWGPRGNWGSKDWESWAGVVSTAFGSAPSGWGPGKGWGNGGGRGGGSGGFGAWGTKASGIACSGTASW